MAILKTEEFTVNIGPQHPSTHGGFHVVVNLDGETVTDAYCVAGYLHRGLEKIAESRTYAQFAPYCARLDYLGAQNPALGYVQTVEKLMGIEVPERAEYIRIILAELARVASHLVFVGSFALDFNGWTPIIYCFRDREKVLDMFDMVCGQRLTTSYMRIGGVADDLPEEFFPAIRKFLDEMPACIDEYDGILTGNEILIGRCKGVGILTAEQAKDWGISGPNLRATGINYDIRKVEPYGIYDRFDFEVPVGTAGDTYERYLMRVAELRQSLRIIEQAVNALPEGPVRTKVPKVLKPEPGEVYHRIESNKGELGFYMVSDGSDKPYRLHIRGPSFVNVAPLPELARGGNIQDVIAVLASIDIVLGEMDR